jgi:hypothetical protein
MTNHEQILGVWEETPIAPISSNSMLLDATHLATQWRRCSQSADFWAHYLSLYMPVPTPPGMLPRKAMEYMLSYLLNELFENCAKFSAGPIQTVCYRSWILEDRMVFQVTNHITPAKQNPFINLIQEFLEGDPHELYFQRLEQNAELSPSGSGLGYLTLMKDYEIRFGFRFRPVEVDSVAVDVQAHINMKEDE